MEDRAVVMAAFDLSDKILSGFRRCDAIEFERNVSQGSGEFDNWHAGLRR
jgi:hypothetical protein